jgi:hypothetical protein
MATKSQKKQTQKYNEEMKRAGEWMKNPTEQQIHTVTNYVVYQILYVNDAACNECKFLGDKLKNIPYKGKGAQKIYGALMKRINAYWEFVNDILKLNSESLAELMGEMDEYMNGAIDGLRDSIRNVLERHGIGNPDWVASVETARTCVEYAIQVTKDYIEGLKKINKEAYALSPFIITEIGRVADNLADFVQQAAGMGKMTIDLNKDEDALRAFKRLNKAFIKPENFIKAAKNADKVNEAEGRIKLM